MQVFFVYSGNGEMELMSVGIGYAQFTHIYKLSLAPNVSKYRLLLLVLREAVLILFDHFVSLNILRPTLYR